MQSDITMKENTETILQLAANTRISCLRPNLFPVREAMLETSCLRSYILFQMFRDQIIYFSLVPRYYRLSPSRTQYLPRGRA